MAKRFLKVTFGKTYKYMYFYIKFWNWSSCVDFYFCLYC